jgi:hypothetical protein
LGAFVGLLRFLNQSGRLAMAIALAGFCTPAVAQDAAPDVQAPANPGEWLGAGVGQPMAPAESSPLGNAPRVYYPADFARTAPLWVRTSARSPRSTLHTRECS